MVAITDESGAYAFRAVPPGSYRVSVVVPGFEAAVQFVYVSVGLTSVADFQLLEAIEEGVGTVEGTVTGSDGAPLLGALVTIYAEENYVPPRLSEDSRRAAAAAGRRVEPKDIWRGWFSTLTDRSGHYSLNVPSGYLYLEVSADGFLPAVRSLVLRPDETLTVDVALEPAPPPVDGAVEGTVTDAKTGAALAGVRVEVLVPVVDPGGTPLPLFTAYTDRRGFYRIKGVPQGVWGVSATLKGYAPQAVDVEIGSGTVTVDFALYRKRD